MISILCPCYNEEKALPIFIQRITETVSKIPEQFEIVFVNDGSTDSTLDLLKKYSSQDKRIKVIDLSRNFGKEAALTAALDYSSGDAVIPIDADLQHPLELIPEMLGKWREGYEVVLVHHNNRSYDTGFKIMAAKLFYRVYNLISHPKIPGDVGDFRLLDRKVADALSEFRESVRFMKGLYAFAGFRTCTLNYDFAPRIAGEAKFRSRQLRTLALDGITSFSTAPLTVWLYLGGTISFCAFAYLAYMLLSCGTEISGCSLIMCLVIFFGGLNLTAIGFIGLYLGRTYIESKRRPIYIVRKVYGDTE